MRYSLRTLMVVMLLGGPLLAGLWWFRDYVLFFVFRWGVFLPTALFIVYSLIAPLPGAKQRVNIHPVWTVGLAVWTCVVVGFYVYAFCMIAGWLFIWGDMPERHPETAYVVPVFAVVTAFATGVPMLKIALGWSTYRYLAIILSLLTMQTLILVGGFVLATLRW